MYSFLSHSTPVLVSQAPAEILQIKNHVCAGFPSPAEDLGAQRIDLTSVLIKYPQQLPPSQISTNLSEEPGL